MHLEHCKMYHIYNRGINRETIFKHQHHYDYFTLKMQKYLLGHVILMAYCLMPNHFHWMVYITEKTNIPSFQRSVGILLRSYALGVNRQLQRVGSLFQQKTKAKCLSPHPGDNNRNLNQPLNCFCYIHRNPLISGYVQRLEQWSYSSYTEFLDTSRDALCDTQFTSEILMLPPRTDLPELMTKLPLVNLPLGIS